MWVQKQKLKILSEKNPLLTIKLCTTLSSGNSQNIPLGKTTLKTSSILDSFPEHPTKVTVRNKLLSEMHLCRETPPSFALHSKPELPSKQ